MSRYISAKEAAQRLGVSLPTLYAYVSRGLVRSESTGDGHRERHYRGEDVQRLVERKQLKRNPSKLPEGSLHWGTPILDSALTLIEDGRLFYRGQHAIDLAMHRTFEEVAALMWLGDMDKAPALFHKRRGDVAKLPAKMAKELLPVERMMVVLPVLAYDDRTASDLRPPSVAWTGARILKSLTATLTASHVGRNPIAEVLQRHFAPTNLATKSLFDAALIVCADHELNTSSFTARCVASTRATPYAVVSAGLAALQGELHGGDSERVLNFLREIGTPAKVRSVCHAQVRQAGHIPGFGHALYPEGDPRAALLLAMLPRVFGRSSAISLAQALVEEARTLNQEPPTIDFALAAIAFAVDAPVGSALGLFALGRTAGWLAHAIEQYSLNRIIRPRARYVGPRPIT